MVLLNDAPVPVLDLVDINGCDPFTPVGKDQVGLGDLFQRESGGTQGQRQIRT